jgi:hypothetical protein
MRRKMKKLVNPILIIGILVFLNSCVILSSSMTPSQVDRYLPTLTKSKYLTRAQAETAVKANSCRYLVKGREYVAPLGLTVNGDLRNGARGIDEWVQLDGGNAYVLVSYKWVRVDNEGSTQLHLEFDTMLCE